MQDRAKKLLSYNDVLEKKCEKQQAKRDERNKEDMDEIRRSVEQRQKYEDKIEVLIQDEKDKRKVILDMND